MILVGGYNVYPRDVDEILFSHPTDPRSGGGRSGVTAGWARWSAAFVVLDQGAGAGARQSFSPTATEAMVKYKRPVEVHFVDALPKTGTNKISRPKLRELLREFETS